MNEILFNFIISYNKVGWTKESFKNDIQLQWMIKQLNWKPNDQKINWKLFAKKKQ